MKFGTYKISDVFEISGSKTTTKTQLEKFGIGVYPYVTTQAVNNGIAGYYNFFTEEGNCLTIDSAVAGSCFYQSKNFSASDHVEILRPKFEMNRILALYFCILVNKNAEFYGYSYSKKRSQKAIKDEILLLPIDKNGQIDFKFMEKYIKSIEAKMQKLILYHKVLALRERERESKSCGDFNLIFSEDSSISNFIKDAIMQIANSLFDKLGVKWGEFKLVDLFDYERGTRLTKNNRENGIYPLVTAGEINLGVKEFISNKNQKIFNNAITIDMFCNSFVHINDFCCDDNVLVLTSRVKISTQVMHFISAVINKSKDKFGYGRQYRQNTLEKHIVHLPIDKLGKPNFTLMENFIKDIEKKYTHKLINYYKFLTMGGSRAEFNLAYYEKFQNLEWKEFRIDDLFEIKKGKRLTKSQMKDGDINFIGATSTNNGITAKISNDTHLHPSNTISVTYNGSVGEAFYQPSRFWASDDVNVLYPKFKNNKFLSLFFTAIFRKQGQKYGYNRKWTKEIMQEDKILLPTYGGGQIAFDLIEEYISQVQNKMRNLLLSRD